MTYDINNLSELENSVTELFNVNEKIKGNTNSLESIIKQINQNWTNDEGEDITSILKELDDCVQKLAGAIIPTVDEYVSTMNTLAENSRKTQSNTI